MPGSSAHHRVSAAVQSRARRTSYALWQKAIVLQYTMPATIGDSSPVVTATMVSSTSRKPSSARPSLTSAWPRSISPIASRSRSAKRAPISAISTAVACAAT
jgi:hypothetical protein